MKKHKLLDSSFLSAAKIEDIKREIENSTDVNVRTSGGRTPLMLVARWRSYPLEMCNYCVCFIG